MYRWTWGNWQLHSLVEATCGSSTEEEELCKHSARKTGKCLGDMIYQESCHSCSLLLGKSFIFTFFLIPFTALPKAFLPFAEIKNCVWLLSSWSRLSLIFKLGK